MTKCENCKEEVTRARWIEDVGWFCKRCDPGVGAEKAHKNVSGSMFPFYTTHLSPKYKNVKVNSLRHLRQLENKYGAGSVAFNYNESRFNDPPRGR